MGDRWNIHNDEIQDRLYRETVPWHVRALRNLVATIVVGGIFVTLLWAGLRM